MRASSLAVTIAVLLLAPVTAVAQTSADTAAIRATAHDFIDGWYSGDADRMERALHTHLAKRLVYTDAQGQSQLVERTAADMIQATRAGKGKIPREQWRDSVTILDVYGNVAMVRLDSNDFVDFLQEMKWNGAWKIVNDVWENRAAKR